MVSKLLHLNVLLYKNFHVLGIHFGSDNIELLSHNMLNGIECVEQIPAATLYTAKTNSESQILPSDTNNSKDVKLSKTFLYSKLIHIGLLAILQNMVLIFSDFLVINFNKYYLGAIFIPLIMYDINYFIFYSSKNSNKSFISAFLNNDMTKYIKILTCFLQVMQDMLTYFFIFIVLYKSLTVLK